jgi:trigger factor
VRSTVEPVEGNKVKLSVEVDEAEFEEAVDAAFKKLAREVRIPGFRPGKAPRRVLEARLGSGVGRSQALNDALPDYYEQAVIEHEVDVIAPPEIDITDGEEEGQVAFDAVVEVRPQVSLPGYQNLRVTASPNLPTDDDVDEQLERLRGQYSTLEEVDRPAVDDDVVTIDVQGTQGGEELDGLTTDDYGYPVGSGSIVPEFDENLRGAKAGDILEFDAEHPEEGEESLHFRILVKQVQARVLPELDDAFAEEASEFSTLAELRDSLFDRLDGIRRQQGAQQLQEKIGAALAELVEEDPPEPLVGAEIQQRIQDMAMQLQAQGIDPQAFLESQDQQQMVENLKETATTRVKVDLALRAVAEGQDLEATDEDLDEEFAQAAEALGQDAAEVRARFERAGQMPAVRSDVKKRKAFEWLLERVEIVDEDGNPLDRSDFEPRAVDEDADHDDGEDADGTDESAGTADEAGDEETE